jgi:hypothetical protein
MTRYIIQMDYNPRCPWRRRYNLRVGVPELAAFLALCGGIEGQYLIINYTLTYH